MEATLGAFGQTNWANTVVGPDRIFFLVPATNSNSGPQTYVATYTKDYKTIVPIGPDYTAASQILRNLALLGIAKFGTTLRAYSAFKDGSNFFIDSSDDGKSWSDPTNVGGSLPREIVEFDGSHAWGCDAGNLYRAGI